MAAWIELVFFGTQASHDLFYGNLGISKIEKFSYQLLRVVNNQPTTVASL